MAQGGSSGLLAPISPLRTEPVFVDPLRSPEIDSQPGGPVRQPFMLYQSPYLETFMEPRNRFRGIDSARLGSIPGLHKRSTNTVSGPPVNRLAASIPGLERLQIRAQPKMHQFMDLLTI
jgi:hypothetical protein